MILENHDQVFNKPVDARNAGIEAVYQDLALCNHLTAASNVFLGRENDSKDMALRKHGLYQPHLTYLANYFILSGKMNEISRTHLRTYQQMMRGGLESLFLNI